MRSLILGGLVSLALTSMANAASFVPVIVPVLTAAHAAPTVSGDDWVNPDAIVNTECSTNATAVEQLHSDACWNYSGILRPSATGSWYFLVKHADGGSNFERVGPYGSAIACNTDRLRVMLQAPGISFVSDNCQGD